MIMQTIENIYIFCGSILIIFGWILIIILFAINKIQKKKINKK